MHHNCLRELQKYAILPSYCAQIHAKDGIELYRIAYKGESMVLKLFTRGDFTREINHYKRLSKLGIRTLKIHDATDVSLLMEDLDGHPTLRLGTPNDLYAPEVLRPLARWYSALHKSGRTLDLDGDYKETDCLTLEALEKVMRLTQTQAMDFWPKLFYNFHHIESLLDNQALTLTYNDFFWTNLVVAKDGSDAFMFDYNMMGAGSAYSDISNVCSSLPEDSKPIFLKNYGPVDTLEAHLTHLTADLIGLITAYDRPVFPAWAASSVEAIKDGSLTTALDTLLLKLKTF